MLESEYQAKLIKRLKWLFPGCEIFKNDASRKQGVPDLTVLFSDRWVMLEVKASKDAKIQPNQPHYVEKFNRMSYAAFIYPENEEEILHAVQQALRFCRVPLGPQREQVPLAELR